ncbi:hypothetical protein [Microbacterium sp. NPDC089188]|uniref:hypothetical protein n=1 Tax=Microbacterium sp. NPDC089188 TaxID=3154971 RepID=UPI00342FD8A4
MAIILKPAAAQVTRLDELSKLWWIKRKHRSGEYFKISITPGRGARGTTDLHILRAEDVEASEKNPVKLTHSRQVNKAWWLIGESVYVVNDLDLTAGDILAIREQQLAKRDAQLRRAQAAYRGTNSDV